MTARAARPVWLARLLCALTAAGALAAGLFLALNHPLGPGALLVAFVGWGSLVAWRPDLWLLAVPAALPLLNFAPWSGWLSFDEFDLLLLGTIAGGHARLAWRGHADAGDGAARLPAIVLAAAGLFVAVSVVALWRGFSDAGGFEFGWFQSYVDPMNSVRVFKPLLWAVLLVPLMQAAIRASAERAMSRVGVGMCLGLAVVTLAVVWERHAYPGLDDFSRPYRAVGLFWEMHVGGAAIDAYLAMAAPFAAWALWSARTPLRWSIAALLTLLTGYACLTTFSRGVYLAVLAPLLLLALLLWGPWRADTSTGAFMRRALAAGATAVPLAFVVSVAFVLHGYLGAGVVGVLALLALGLTTKRWAPALGWRGAASRALAAALLVEALAVVWTGSFLIERMSRSERDLSGRIAHWSKGLRLLYEPSDWVFGIGLGRLPSHYTRFVEGYEFSGAVQPVPEAEGRHSVRLYGPATRRQLEGLYSLTQRVPLREGAQYRVDFDYRVHEKVGLYVGVCELHLLYERRCQARWVDVEPGKSTWQHLSLDLTGPDLTTGDGFAPRLAVFELSLLGAGTQAEFSNLGLQAGDSGPLLRNGDFSRQLAHWFPSAQGYFVPWHIDNLYLELLVERGPLGLAAFVVLMGWTLRRLVGASGRGATWAPFLAASLSGVVLIGLLSSVLDVPRTAFLLFFLMGFSALLFSPSGRKGG